MLLDLKKTHRSIEIESPEINPQLLSNLVSEIQACLTVLHFTDDVFLQTEGKTLHQYSDFTTYFIAILALLQWTETKLAIFQKRTIFSIQLSLICINILAQVF